MPKISTRIAVVALMAALTAVSPAIAAPGNNGFGMKAKVDCTLPENADNPFCTKGPGSRAGNGTDGTGGTGPMAGAPQDNGPGANGPPPDGNGKGDGKWPGKGNGSKGQWDKGPGQGYGNGPAQGSFQWSKKDRNHFHQQFGNSFGYFATPNFSIQLGFSVPKSYGLHYVPKSIYRVYPWFRGYLFFVTRHGDFVIVSPKSHRIVAVL